MNTNRLILAASLFFASASFAEASRDPTPPPSGIVVHLFGPNSIMSNVVPDLPGETAKRPAPVPGQTASPGATASAGGTNMAAPSTETSNDPSWHDVLHQMFVTGDPDAPNRPAPGRAAERENIK